MSRRLWDTVAYIRTLTAGAETAAQAPSSTSSKASASTADLVMARLRLSIWPEYDDPRVLIMLRGEMTPRQAFPASITLPIPKGAEIIGAGMISEQNELLLHPHQVLPGDTQDTLQLNLPVPRFFVEFYYNPFTTSGPEKRFVYSAPTTYPIDLFEVDIQQPLKATAFTVDPPSMERTTDKEGFTYHQFTYRDVGKGQSQTFTIAYTKNCHRSLSGKAAVNVAAGGEGTGTLGQYPGVVRASSPEPSCCLQDMPGLHNVPSANLCLPRHLQGRLSPCQTL